MRCYDIESDSIVSAQILIDDVVRPEYGVVTHNSTLQCLVTVKPEQVIKVTCHVHTSIRRFRMDLIVDTVLRDTKVVRLETLTSRSESFSTACFGEKTAFQRGTMKVPSLSSGKSTKE